MILLCCIGWKKKNEKLYLKSKPVFFCREGPENNQPINSLKISFEDELQLTLYRHWSLFESICKSVKTACKFKVWTMKGRKRLHEFLAEMGLAFACFPLHFTSLLYNHTFISDFYQCSIKSFCNPTPSLLKLFCSHSLSHTSLSLLLVLLNNTDLLSLHPNRLNLRRFINNYMPVKIIVFWNTNKSQAWELPKNSCFLFFFFFKNLGHYFL